jgi:hypothetical protein
MVLVTALRWPDSTGTDSGPAEELKGGVDRLLADTCGQCSHRQQKGNVNTSGAYNASRNLLSPAVFTTKSSLLPGMLLETEICAVLAQVLTLHHDVIQQWKPTASDMLPA